jgi:putative ABC transport system permease protein
MIELKRLSKTYRQGSQVLPVLRGIDLVIGRGEAEDADPVALESRIRTLLSTRHRFAASALGALFVYNSLAEYQKFSALFTGITLFTTVVGVGTLFAGLVGVGNIMLIAVRERTREIGIRKAVGATPSSILAMILQEALLLTAASGYVGLIAGIDAIELLRWSGFKTDYFRVRR